MIEEKLTVTLSAGCRWLTGKVVSTSSKVRADISILNDDALVFDFGLFRCKEHIRFEALAEVATVREKVVEDSEAAGKRLVTAMMTNEY